MNTKTDSTIPSQTRAVLVTGCSSGIGRAAAVHLARRGFTVFATVRKETSADSLRQAGLPGLIPVCPLDLSDPEQLRQAAQTVQAELDRRGISGLYALINNAGAGAVAPIELMDLAAFRADLLARLAGPVGLLQAFLPRLRQARGRVLWITTPALMPIPYVASIHACDFAVNCLARTLELELKPWGIPSIMIRCGGIKTAASERTARQMAEDMRGWPADRSALYADALKKEQAALGKFDEQRSEPEEVSHVIYQALTARRPRRRYSVGHLSRLAAVLELFPQPLVDRIMAMRKV